ncbi:MAG: hypothetical protein A3J31_00210 [Candidatus Taylorbacteria bacterium RIFCSPLOWO2_02_FULL_48_16]|nr:MAG: hypothetical protein A3J31_00210 [Candidatus Taylorbacteria bacterium RIFCSPLOWO2_02_FULL_48_16]
MNQQQQKMITQLTDQELLQIGQNDPVTAGKIKSVFEQGIEQIRYQLEYIRETLSDFTQRTALLMTIAGLLAFLPPFVGFGTDYLRHFLIWTFPFLILSLICFYFSSPRINALIKQFPTAVENSPEELLILKSQSIALGHIWARSIKLYDSVLEWYRFTSAFVYLYITSLIVNFYLFVFIGKPDLCASLLLFFSLLVLGIWMIVHNQAKSQKGLDFGPTQLNIGVGAPAMPKQHDQTP